MVHLTEVGVMQSKIKLWFGFCSRTKLVNINRKSGRGESYDVYSLLDDGWMVPPVISMILHDHVKAFGNLLCAIERPRRHYLWGKILGRVLKRFWLKVP